MRVRLVHFGVRSCEREAVFCDEGARGLCTWQGLCEATYEQTVNIVNQRRGQETRSAYSASSRLKTLIVSGKEII
jgi:hypothetical protein